MFKFLKCLCRQMQKYVLSNLTQVGQKSEPLGAGVGTMLIRLADIEIYDDSEPETDRPPGYRPVVKSLNSNPLNNKS